MILNPILYPDFEKDIISISYILLCYCEYTLGLTEKVGQINFLTILAEETQNKGLIKVFGFISTFEYSKQWKYLGETQDIFDSLNTIFL